MITTGPRRELNLTGPRGVTTTREATGFYVDTSFTSGSHVVMLAQ